MPDKRYTKVEEEIIQILDRLEKEEPSPTRPNLRLVHSRPVKQRNRFLGHRKPSLTVLPAWTNLAVAFGLAFAAVLLRETSHLLAVMVAIASVVAFDSPLFLNRAPGRGMSQAPGGGPPGTKTWRGRDITFGPTGGPTAADRARRWLDDRRGRR